MLWKCRNTCPVCCFQQGRMSHKLNARMCFLKASAQLSESGHDVTAVNIVKHLHGLTEVWTQRIKEIKLLNWIVALWWSSGFLCRVLSFMCRLCNCALKTHRSCWSAVKGINILPSKDFVLQFYFSWYSPAFLLCPDHSISSCSFITYRRIKETSVVPAQDKKHYHVK